MIERNLGDGFSASRSSTQTEPRREVVRSLRVLTLTTVDITLGKLLLPLIHALRDQGFVSECASADGSYAEELRAEGFEVHSVPFKRKVMTPSHIAAFLRIYRLMRQRRYDVVHVHTPFAQVIGRIAARLAGVPVVLYTSHGFQFHDSRSPWARAVIIGIERWLGRWTDLIFTQSKEDAETAVRIGIAPRDRVLWIGNGIQLDRFNPKPMDVSVREEFDLGPGHKVVGFIGRIVREKGVVELIEAMARVVSEAPDTRLLVVGDTLASDGDTAAKRLVQEAIREHGLEDKVRFAGLRDDIPCLLRAMDVFVLPSWREGMPRSIIEAMAIGLPVVATDIRGCREEVVHGETGLLVPPKRPDRLAEAILALVSDPALAGEMGARGRQRAVEWFDERQVVQRQLVAYEELVERKGLVG
jgi:glycosyltransferase involved in cell wall biosynthesis